MQIWRWLYYSNYIQFPGNLISAENEVAFSLQMLQLLCRSQVGSKSCINSKRRLKWFSISILCIYIMWNVHLDHVFRCRIRGEFSPQTLSGSQVRSDSCNSRIAAISSINSHVSAELGLIIPLLAPLVRRIRTVLFKACFWMKETGARW